MTKGKWKLFPHLQIIHRALLDVAAGVCPRLMVLCPPQHGKSLLCSLWFPTWFLGNFPDKRIILASYQHDFAASWGRRTRETLEAFGQELFGIRVKQEVRSSDWFEIAGHEGAMYTAGAGGSITGKGCDIGIIDDPHANAEEAGSEKIRNTIHEWERQTFRSRVHEGGGIILVCTRWHQDDLAGRLLGAQDEGGDNWRVIRFPALAKTDEDWGTWKRKAGEALCPALYTRETLEATKRDVGEWIFSTQYQAAPFAREGNFFKPERLELVESAPRNAVRVRLWDLAASVGGDYTVGLRLAKDENGILWVEHVERFRETPGARDQRILKVTELDGRDVKVMWEEEPGSAGLAQTESLRKLLFGSWTQGVRSTGDKTVRAGPIASAIEAGRVKIVRGTWNQALLDELRAFPAGKNDDQVDALALAFNYLAPIQVPDYRPEKTVSIVADSEELERRRENLEDDKADDPLRQKNKWLYEFGPKEPPGMPRYNDPSSIVEDVYEGQPLPDELVAAMDGMRKGKRRRRG